MVQKTFLIVIELQFLDEVIVNRFKPVTQSMEAIKTPRVNSWCIYQSVRFRLAIISLRSGSQHYCNRFCSARFERVSNQQTNWHESQACKQGSQTPFVIFPLANISQNCESSQKFVYCIKWGLLLLWLYLIIIAQTFRCLKQARQGTRTSLLARQSFFKAWWNFTQRLTAHSYHQYSVGFWHVSL